MYHGKNLLLPQNRKQLSREGWHATILYLWTRGVIPPLFECRVSGLPDGVGTREARLVPTVAREDRALVLGTGARSMNRCPCGNLCIMRSEWAVVIVIGDVLTAQTCNSARPWLCRLCKVCYGVVSTPLGNLPPARGRVHRRTPHVGYLMVNVQSVTASVGLSCEEMRVVRL